MKFNHVDGKHAGDVKLFSLTSCPWCHKIKQLLSDEDVEYDYIDVDLTYGRERKKIIEEVEKYSPKLSFPLLLINDRPIIRFHEEEIRDNLKMALASYHF